MSTDSEEHAAAREHLSALVDGELDGGAVARACSHWRESPELQSSWHAYHLIGDVLRSDDLAVDPARDAAFLQAFRARLADEPVVLAPRLLESSAPVALPAAARVANGTRSKQWSWMAPSAVAAGFVAVAGVLMLTGAPGPSPDRQGGAPLAQVTPDASVAAQRIATASTLTGPTAMASEPPTFVASDQLIRDARLDRYLAAHKQFAGSSALGVPSAFLRNATADASGR